MLVLVLITKIEIDEIWVILVLVKGKLYHFWSFWKKIITNSYFNVYMSKCRQFEGLSTGMSILTIPNHTIKLQLH